jgi:hypothetical protein
MKPRDASTAEVGDMQKPILGCVNQTKTVDEFKNIPGTVTNLTFITQDKPIPGVVSTEFEVK